MKYKKLLKKAAVSLLLAQSLIFTGLPIQAADIAGQSMVWMESVESGKRRMFQGTWQQQDEDGLDSMLYDTSLSDTSQFRFTIPKMDYPLDDRHSLM